jgi:hypothetical protein
LPRERRHDRQDESVCATTIAEGVKRIPSDPRGPAREEQEIDDEAHHDRRIPSAALSATIAPRRPGKRAMAIHAPRGKPSAHARTVEARLTFRDSQTIDQRSRVGAGDEPESEPEGGAKVRHGSIVPSAPRLADMKRSA